MTLKKTILAAVILAAFVSVNTADARGGRGFSSGRSMSARTYRAPVPKAKPKTTVIQKNTTVINQRQTNVQNEGSSGSGFWSGVAGAAVGSMAGNLAYDALTDDKQAAPAPAPSAPAQPQVIYVPVGPDGKPIQPTTQQ